MSDAVKDIEKAILSWRQLREKRLEEEKIAAETKKLEDAAQAYIIDTMRELQMDGLIVDGKATGVTAKEVYIVADKAELERYILETGELDLVSIRLSDAAVKERAEHGVTVPGVGMMTKYSLFNRKA